MYVLYRYTYNMAYVTQRPLVYDLTSNAENIQETNVQMKYNFKDLLRNPKIKSWEDTEIGMGGIMMTTPPSNKKVFEFNGKEYIYNYLAFTKNGDVFADVGNDDNSTKQKKMFAAIMVLSDPHYIEKLYIIHPIVEGLGVSTENRELITIITNALQGNGIIQGSDTTHNVELEYDINKFIPQKKHFFYQYKTPNNNISSVIVIDPMFSEFNLETNDYNSLRTFITEWDDNEDVMYSSTTGQIFKMTSIAKKIVQEDPEGDENIMDDQIYIDCQPITDRDNKVHIMDPIRIESKTMGSFYSLDSHSAVVYRMIICTIVLIISSISAYRNQYNRTKFIIFITTGALSSIIIMSDIMILLDRPRVYNSL